MQKFEIIVVGHPAFIADHVRDSWARARVHLLGPVLPHELDYELARRCGGVLMDIAIEADLLFEVSEQLLARDVSFLFVVATDDGGSSLNPYVLGADPAERHAILDALARDGHEAAEGNLH